MKDIKFIYKDSNNKYYYSFKNEIIYGKDKLIQDIIKQLLTLKGSNLYDPEFGTDFLKNVHERSYSLNSNDEFSTVAAFAVNNIKDSIIRDQTNKISRGENLSPSEILEDIVINRLEYDKYKYSWEIDLYVKTSSGVTILEI